MSRPGRRRWRAGSRPARARARDVDAEVVEEAPVLGRQHRLDQIVRHLLQRHRVALVDAALADLVAVAVEEGDGEIALGPPVAAGRVQGGDGECQHEHRAAGAERKALAQQLHDARASMPVTRKRRMNREIAFEAAGDCPAGRNRVESIHASTSISRMPRRRLRLLWNGSRTLLVLWEPKRIRADDGGVGAG